MTKFISVVICTHNPRQDYLNRVLDALKLQRLENSRWELLLIDNGSSTPLSAAFDLSWHPNGRFIVEAELGLTNARVRGIIESSGDLIIFVDDDNVLAPDYLQCAFELAGLYPHIGAFGGSVSGEFEEPPAAWAKPYLHLLAIRELKRDNWSNLLFFNDSTPVGAGACVRRSVAEAYRLNILKDDRRRALDRVGTGTGSAGDCDMAYCAIDLGMGTATFERLKVLHLIARRRLTLDYIARLSAGIFSSQLVLQSFRDQTPAQTRSPWLSTVQFWGKLLVLSKADRKIALATHSGRKKAQKFLSGGAGADKTLLQS